MWDSPGLSAAIHGGPWRWPTRGELPPSRRCNFLAILASTTSGNPAYVYSGYLMGFIHLGNALYLVDPETYWTIRDQLPETVEADLAYNNAYWDQFRDSVVQQASNRIYDGMLKAYGRRKRNCLVWNRGGFAGGLLRYITIPPGAHMRRAVHF